MLNTLKREFIVMSINYAYDTIAAEISQNLLHLRFTKSVKC